MVRKVLLAATILMTPWVSEAQTTARLDLDWPAVAGKILERLALEPGARVLLVARPGMFDGLIPHLRYAVTEAGGTDLGVIDVLAGLPFRPRWTKKPWRGAAGTPARFTVACSATWTRP